MGGCGDKKKNLENPFYVWRATKTEEKIKVKFMEERKKGTKIENLWKLFE